MNDLLEPVAMVNMELGTVRTEDSYDPKIHPVTYCK